MTDAMRSASKVSRSLAMKTGDEKWILDFKECVYLATKGGAEVVGLGGRD
jgi:guanine deaminase